MASRRADAALEAQKNMYMSAIESISRHNNAENVCAAHQAVVDGISAVLQGEVAKITMRQEEMRSGKSVVTQVGLRMFAILFGAGVGFSIGAADKIFNWLRNL